jgi:signal transduction histidine kinase
MVQGSRTIGAVGIWGEKKLGKAELGKLERLARKMAGEYLSAVKAKASRPPKTPIALKRRRSLPILRTGRLELIRDLSPQIIGLTDTRQVAQVAASRISQHFGRQPARLVLIDRNSADLVAASAGAASSHNGGLAPFFMTDPENAVASQVLRTGRSLLLGGPRGRKAAPRNGKGSSGSRLCVALNQGGHILGIVELRSPQNNAFSAEDLQDVECAAAIVAAVISAANRPGTEGAASLPFASNASPGETRVTSQRLPESRLVQAAKLMSVGEMAAGIAHELNNPLTTVAGFAELLLDEIPADAAFRGDVEMVMHEAQRARSVVRRLLDFARQGEGARARADIGEIVEDVVALTTHFMHNSGVKLELDLAKDLPWILVDSNQMKQVFLNLIHNALQAMPAGGNLQVRTEAAQNDDRRWVVVRITDNGLGIRPADISRIFEPFFTTRAQHGGTGLGLSVSYGIVADHGGKIEVESRPGVGSTFSVWLPV